MKYSIIQFIRQTLYTRERPFPSHLFLPSLLHAEDDRRTGLQLIRWSEFAASRSGNVQCSDEPKVQRLSVIVTLRCRNSLPSSPQVCQTIVLFYARD